MEISDNQMSDLMEQKPVAFVCDNELLAMSDNLPKIKGRATVVHSLIQAYGLLRHMRLVSPRHAKEQEIAMFHSQPYIDCLRRLSDIDDEEKYDEEAEQFGLSYDCPAYPGVFDYASYVAGASIRAAQCLMMDVADVAIHWTGGWHHAKRDEASGFCYFNDIVIAILKLREKFDRILYVDIDLHHGDGVEDAFCATQKIMTVSFHKFSPGFFPGTGHISDIGIGKGKYYTVNVPLMDGITDKQFCQVFERVMTSVQESFKPQVVVCQCGADALVGDPMDSFNLTPDAYVNCVQFFQRWKIPLLLLGGGGYNKANTARCWTRVTAGVLGVNLAEDIPEHQNFPMYGPDYSLSLTPGNRPNKTSTDYIETVVSRIHENLKNVNRQCSSS